MAAIPAYQHDAKTYKAVHQWLGFTHPPAPPLSEFIYSNVACDMHQLAGRWEYNELQASQSTSEAARQRGIALDKPFAPHGFALFLKHLFRGMHHAAAAGYEHAPHQMGVAPDNGARGVHCVIGMDEHGKPSLFLLNLNGLHENVSNLAGLARSQLPGDRKNLRLGTQKIEEMGFMLQYVSHHASLSPQPDSEAIYSQAAGALQAWKAGRGRN